MRRPLGVILALTLALVPGCAPPESAAHWPSLDGRVLGTNRGSKIGDSRRLTLEPFADNRQLESIHLADSLEPTSEQPLFASRS